MKLASLKEIEKVEEDDIIRLFFARIKIGKTDKIEINGRKFKTDNEYKKEKIHEIISKLYKEVYRGKQKNKGKKEGD